MGFFTRVRPEDLKFMPVTEGVETECLIPIPEPMKIGLVIQSPKPVSVFWIKPDGEVVLLASGEGVHWKGHLQVGSVQIVTSTSFWYVCHQSRLFEFVDPTPMSVELVHSPEDVLRAMIDERLRVWKIQNDIDRELSEDEKDELVFDLVKGDLEFDDVPDEFGLGYEERLAQYHAEQNKPQESVTPEVPAGTVEEAPTVPAAGSNSSST